MTATFETVEKLSKRIDSRLVLIAGHFTALSTDNVIGPAAAIAADRFHGWGVLTASRMHYQVALRFNAAGLDFPIDMPPVVVVDCAVIKELDRELLGGQKIKHRGVPARREIDPGALGLAHYGALILESIDEAHQPTILRIVKAIRERSISFEMVVERGACGKGRRDRVEEFTSSVQTVLIGTCGLCPCGGTGIPEHLIGLSPNLHACKCGSSEGYPERLAETYGMKLVKI